MVNLWEELYHIMDKVIPMNSNNYIESELETEEQSQSSILRIRVDCIMIRYF